MGEKWVSVRDGAREATLKASDPAGSRRREPLGATRRVPLAWPDAGPWPPGRAHVAAEARSRSASRSPCSVAGRPGQAARRRSGCRMQLGRSTSKPTYGDDGFGHPIVVGAPKDGRPSTRINWMLRQLAPPRRPADRGPLPEPERADVVLAEGRNGEARASPIRDGPEAGASSFRLTMSKDLGMKRGRLAGSFVLESKHQTSDFYRSIVQGLRTWAVGAPKLPLAATASIRVASPEPPPFTSEDRDFGEAVEPRG